MQTSMVTFSAGVLVTASLTRLARLGPPGRWARSRRGTDTRSWVTLPVEWTNTAAWSLIRRICRGCRPTSKQALAGVIRKIKQATKTGTSQRPHLT